MKALVVVACVVLFGCLSAVNAACKTDSDCTDPTLPFCVDGDCAGTVSCSSDEGCIDHPNARSCIEGQCVARVGRTSCTSDNDCVNAPEGPYCDNIFGGGCSQTVMCSVSECEQHPSIPFCYNEQCVKDVPCQSDANCNTYYHSVPYCVNNKCAAEPTCSSDDDCTGHAGLPYCDGTQY